MTGSICPECQAAIRTATAALAVLNDANAADEDLRIAADELARASDHLRPSTKRCPGADAV
jgi:hypothetical protein